MLSLVTICFGHINDINLIVDDLRDKYTKFKNMMDMSFSITDTKMVRSLQYCRGYQSDENINNYADRFHKNITQYKITDAIITENDTHWICNLYNFKNMYLPTNFGLLFFDTNDAFAKMDFFNPECCFENIINDVCVKKYGIDKNGIEFGDVLITTRYLRSFIFSFVVMIKK